MNLIRAYFKKDLDKAGCHFLQVIGPLVRETPTPPSDGFYGDGMTYF